MTNPIISAARGEAALDLAIENIQLVNVFSGEIYPAAIGIYQDKIVHVTRPGETSLAANQVIDGQGKFAIPGLIDTHLHIESSMLTPGAYAEAVLPHGTTTIVTDPHEIGNVLGEEGIAYMIDASKEVDLRILTYLPSCVPSAPKVETAGADFTPEVIERLLQWDGIDGLAEVMNYVGVVQQDERMIKIVEAAKKAGKIAQGHAPTVTGRDLSAYLVAGVDSDHESRTGEEALEKIQAGMYVEIRESSFSLNMSPIAAYIKDKGYLPNVCLCSDDVKANHLVQRGHMNHVVRRAIEEGINPVNAIRFGTLNAAERLQRKDIGAIAPSRIADIVLLDSLEDMVISDVFTAGNHVVTEGKLQFEQPKLAPPKHFFNTVKVDDITEDDFTIDVTDKSLEEANVRVIEYDFAPGIPTNFIETTLPIINGELSLESYQGKKAPLNYIGVFHRHGKNHNKTVGILAGYGIKEGAVATTVAHDSHHLAVLGVNKKDMAIAANRAKELNGGMVAVKDGEIVAELPLPVAGLMSTDTAEELTPKIDAFVNLLQDDIMPGKNPIHRLIAVTLPVIPKAKISDLGLVDVDRQEIVPLFMD
ncbi:adenine deaminase [Gracilibacillus caseinilyticus]|uniref:Adenine deaminase n=1 Tax=Gracilibacillus caseinilyticus TaxID=2932256 RepID=A0ABY4EQZ2_9BACI|nr:adenine deaminase [Gracilibacillus caseinilyticus]UOQ46618.1 adenine deaminase [Gracilibacillus caseinilyticus]